MKYFAYGSNMSLLRLQARVPSAQKLGMYMLADHQLRFDKVGADGSGKGHASVCHNQQIFGVIYQIKSHEKPQLDQIEGLGHGYEIKSVTVNDLKGNSVEAFTYYATEIDPSLQPYSWYLNHVLVGAKESGLPLEYLQKIHAVKTIFDSNKHRESRERAIYG
ncbi:gamma-glutamylcyclotransferase family protein [Thalassotalea sp. G2M2-11]|uniref:gamma-glutamylcyclotransferase family protein n=1 Tax=Thalassotalea sp. G2M2-11 TaxID=2787627 RepID=UPI0019D2029C|nr:gamma-glutamylcyclotransferase family protein [Thalassotalea sp. G2M2-11]